MMRVRETINGYRIDGADRGLIRHLSANGYECEENENGTLLVQDNHYRGKLHLDILVEDYEELFYNHGATE